jgi:DNA-binding cell septation regulator SpoVG
MKQKKKQTFRSVEILYQPPPAGPNETLPIKLGIQVSRYSSPLSASWKATGALEINNCIKISGFKVIQGKKGHFVSLPSVRNKEGFYLQLVNLEAVEFKQFVQDEFLKLYLETLEEGRDDREAEEVVKVLTGSLKPAVPL